MNKITAEISRRRLLQGMVASGAIAITGASTAKKTADYIKPNSNISADTLAKDESYWQNIASYYDVTKGIINLEHGYWGKMAHPVQEYYIAATKMVNAQNSYYARKDNEKNNKLSIQRIAHALGAYEDEIVITRNATESIHNLIRQYQGLESGDSVLYADVDYPNYKASIAALKQSRGVNVIQLDLPARANQKQLFDTYINAFDANSNLKLILITHVSNQHGMIIPVKKITAEARKRGIDVICDSAQSWGLIDYRVDDLGVDFAAFNLHKWIGSPLGVGALYIRRGSLHKIAPYPSEYDPDNTNISKRVHSGTSNFAANLTIPSALDFHQSIGGANKQARLNYLRSLWVDEAEQLDKIQVLGGTDKASRTGLASIRLKGENTIDDVKHLQQRLENDFGIFTVIRKGLASGGCVRVTPQVFNNPTQIEKLVDALKKINADA